MRQQTLQLTFYHFALFYVLVLNFSNKNIADIIIVTFLEENACNLCHHEYVKRAYSAYSAESELSF